MELAMLFCLGVFFACALLLCAVIVERMLILFDDIKSRKHLAALKTRQKYNKVDRAVDKIRFYRLQNEMREGGLVD